MKRFEKRINYLLHLKYKTSERIFSRNIIDNIIFNERSHFVTNYKEFLIFEDVYEFLKRYYTNEESNIRLKKFINYYSKYSFLFPNYSPLSEAVIIYKNINLKQKVIDDMHNSNKGKYIKDYNNKNENEILDDKIFNSKVYDSIINNSENCLSIFSYDKEIISNENKDDEITELINFVDKIDSNIKNNKKELKRHKNNLNLELDDINNINGKNNTIYMKKKTQISSINLKNTNSISSNILTKNSKGQFKDNNDERKEINNESKNVLVNNKVNKIYKKINVNLLDFSTKNSICSSNSFNLLSRENSLITALNTNKSTNKNSMNITCLKEDNNEKNQKINDMPKKKNILTEKMPLTPIKVNKMKLNNKKHSRNKKKNNNNIKKDSNLKNREKPKINVNIYNDYSHKQKIIDYYYYNKNSKINLTDININNKNIENEKLNSTYNSRNLNDEIRINRNKDKINIIKNKDKYAHQFNYIINNYNNKMTTYNTTIEFNSNIKIIDSNNIKSNIIKNTYETTPLNKSNNMSDIIHKTPYEKKIISENQSYNALKKHKNNNLLDYLLNNKNYFSSFNENKRKKYFSKEICNSIDKKHNKEKEFLKQRVTAHVATLEGILTPYNIKKNNKMFSKIKIKINNNSSNKKNKTISNESIKNHRNILNKNSKTNKNNQIKNYILQNKNLNITNTSISNLTNQKNLSFLTSKIENNNNIYQNYCKIKKEKNDKMNYIKKEIKKDKNYTFCLNSNNINENVLKKMAKKKNKENIKEFNKEKKRKEIISESNEKINQFKMELLKKFKQKI